MNPEESASTPTPEKPDHQLKPHERATAELARFPGLVPGAAEKLGAVWAGTLGALPAEQRAAKAVELMETPMAKRHIDPEYVPSTLPNGAAPSPLRATLSRYADRIDEAKVEALMTRLHPETIYKRPPAIAAHVVKFLGSPEGRTFLRSQPGSAPVAPPRHAGNSLVDRPRADQARDAHGRFQEPESPQEPTKPPRVRSCF